MMDHKAFLFDYDSFNRELRAILEGALKSGDYSDLVSFVTANLGDLRDPYEGQRLDGDWEAIPETRDAHQYGDLALTKYYDPTTDIGLGALWSGLQDLFAKDPSLEQSPILGNTVGPEDNPFDPGKMGSYFQSGRQVCQNLEYLLNLAKKCQMPGIESAIQMLNHAARAKTGLYVTF